MLPMRLDCLRNTNRLNQNKDMNILHIDIETYSSVDLKTSGVYKYSQALDFEVLLFAYAFNDQQVQVVDLAQGEKIPPVVMSYMSNSNILKCAHNANFERQCLKAIGLDIPAEQWYCTAVKSAYCGLPLSLENVSAALNLGDAGKSKEGAALIRYFSIPCKPTLANGLRTQNRPTHHLEKWQAFKDYCKQDVEAERTIHARLDMYELPKTERALYLLDQKINDRGILVDKTLAENAVLFNNTFIEESMARMVQLTGLDNPKSVAQLKKWIGDAMDKEITKLSKGDIPALLQETSSDAVREILELRKKVAKTSIKKYTAMLACIGEDLRARGLFQFYGANRTGRWAGRIVQLQNLPQNHLDNIDRDREILATNNYQLTTLLYDDISSMLSQLVRTAFVAREGYTLAVADFSAIEARVIAWLASEQWRLDVFATHGKIYEASASRMFGVPIEEVTKGSAYRQKGKVAELALGYQGALGALKKMGGESMGLSDDEMQTIVIKWRKANPSIVAMWKDLETCAINAIKYKRPIQSKHKNIIFDCDNFNLTIQLPSGRKLFYNNPLLKKGMYDRESIVYNGMNQETKQWERVDTYGGKITENIVQAVARDLLAVSMLRLDRCGFEIVMHVHDEVVAEVPKQEAEEKLKEMYDAMSSTISWADGLILTADGYITDFYKKD